ncbi:MAG: hypothetical protein Kow00122_17780 [Thermoleophilia bacterium]
MLSFGWRQFGVPRSLHVKLIYGLAAPQSSRRCHERPDPPIFMVRGSRRKGGMGN